MPKERKIKLFLADVLEAADSIMAYTQDMEYDEFVGDKKTRDAVLRNLEVIGKAVKNIPEGFKKKHPEVNWKSAAGMRNKLIHEYFGVSAQIVWKTVKSDIPVLEAQIKKILRE